MNGKPALGYAVASWTLTGFALVLILLLNLLPALFGGLLVFELIHIMEPPLHKRFPDRRNTLIAVALLAGVVTLVVVGLVIVFTLFLNSDAGSIPKLLDRLAAIIVNSRTTLPEWRRNEFPQTLRAQRNGVGVVARECSHATGCRRANGARTALHAAGHHYWRHDRLVRCPARCAGR